MESQLEKLQFARRHLLSALGVGVAALVTRTAHAQQVYPNLTPAQLGYAPGNPPGVDSPLGVGIDCVEGETPACLAQEAQLDQLELSLGDPQYAGGYQCFLKGTKIITATGERPVEDLVSGDLVLTKTKGPRPVKDIVSFGLTKPWPRAANPVCVRRSALAAGIPNADLYLSRAHAILIDDVLVTAESLINDRTIYYARNLDVDELRYFHVKLNSHEVIYAAMAPCESFVDTHVEFAGGAA